jgi:hypothetical protein
VPPAGHHHQLQQRSLRRIFRQVTSGPFPETWLPQLSAVNGHGGEKLRFAAPA